MGVIRRGILGGFSNKVANVVGSSWKGIAVMKALPLSVANPRTSAQTSVRQRFAFVVLFANQILTTIVKPLNDRFASRMSGFNLFVQRNYPQVNENSLQFPELIQLSKGILAAFDTLASTLSIGAGMTVSWLDNTGVGNANATDKAYIVCYNIQRNTLSVSSADQSRSDMNAACDTPADSVIGDTLVVWAAFRKIDGTQVSDTSYFTGVLIA